jgi:reactive intermediate/imine deaminase
MVYLSGSQGMDMKTGKLVAGGVANETTQTLQNLEQVLKAAGSSADRVVGCSVFLKQMSDFNQMNEAYKAFWPQGGALGALPTRVCVQVASLAGSAAVEIQCLAASSDIAADKAPHVVKVHGSPPMPDLPFSAGVTAGGMVYVSGNQGFDKKAGKIVAGGVFNETTQTINNIKDVVEAAGASLADVTSCEVSRKI